MHPDANRKIDQFWLNQSPTSKAVRQRRANKGLKPCGLSFEQMMKELSK